MHVAGLENSMFVGTQAFVGMPQVFVGTQALVLLVPRRLLVSRCLLVPRRGRATLGRRRARLALPIVLAHTATTARAERLVPSLSRLGPTRGCVSGIITRHA